MASMLDKARLSLKEAERLDGIATTRERIGAENGGIDPQDARLNCDDEVRLSQAQALIGILEALTEEDEPCDRPSLHDLPDWEEAPGPEPTPVLDGCSCDDPECDLWSELRGEVETPSDPEPDVGPLVFTFNGKPVAILPLLRYACGFDLAETA